MHYPKRWEKFLPLIEFAYNNEYQESLIMSPFKAMYSKKCNSPIVWDDPIKKVVLGSDMLREMDQEVINIKQTLKASHDMKKSYKNREKMHKEFQVREHVYLHFRLRKISLKVVSCAKLPHKFCGTFQILERVGPIAHRLAFPPTMKEHYVFHIYFLKNDVYDNNHVIDWTII